MQANHTSAQVQGDHCYIYIMLILPRSLIGSMANVKIGSKLLKYRCWETLGEDIGVLGCHGDMENSNMTEGDTLPNKVEINLNVLRALMLDRIGGEVDSTDVVAINQGGTTKMVAKLDK